MFNLIFIILYFSVSSLSFLSIMSNEAGPSSTEYLHICTGSVWWLNGAFVWLALIVKTRSSKCCQTQSGSFISTWSQGPRVDIE